MGQIELIRRVPLWKTEPTPITAPPCPEPAPLLSQGQKSELPLKMAGAPSSPDITLLLETAAPVSAVWFGQALVPSQEGL